MRPLFDAYIMVDWSAASKPVTGVNSIWIGSLTRDVDAALHYESDNPATRDEAEGRLYDRTADLIQRGLKVLIGFDFAVGYPAGTAAALGLETHSIAPWKAMHAYLTERIEHAPDNANARFNLAADMNAAMTASPHPFWGVPAARSRSTLSVKKGNFSQPGSLAEHRRAEAWIRASFDAYPKSVWQLLGVGAVGSQSLLGIPTVSYLRSHLRNTQIWPFETGGGELTSKSLENTACVLAEIYPSTLKITPETGEILDQEQVRLLAKHIESLDSAGNLGAAFKIPNSISDRELHKILGEEGWILAK